MKIDCMVGVFFIIDCCATNILKSIFQVMGITICTISLYISSKKKKPTIPTLISNDKPQLYTFLRTPEISHLFLCSML